MKIKYLLLYAGLTLGLIACHDDLGVEEIEVTYDTVDFDRIELATSSNVRIIQSDLHRVIIRGEKRDVDDTEVRVTNGKLVIEEHGHIAADQIIYIYVPVITRLESLGSSDVYGESNFQQQANMEIQLRGSGEIDMYVDTDNVDIENSGSGDVFLEGITDNIDVFLSGSGWVRTFNLPTDFADVRVSGSGSAEVTVDVDLDVIISGSGDVRYKGHPNINSTITGSGRLIDAN